MPEYHKAYIAGQPKASEPGDDDTRNEVKNLTTMRLRHLPTHSYFRIVAVPFNLIKCF